MMLYEYESNELLSSQSEALEVNHCQLLVGSLQIVRHRELAVLDELLVEEARLLEELVETTLGDVLNHLLWEVCSLLG